MGHPAIWLRREGKHAVVLVELNGEWVEVIRDLADGPFSHIKEALPLTKQERKHLIMDGAIEAMKAVNREQS